MKKLITFTATMLLALTSATAFASSSAGSEAGAVVIQNDRSSHRSEAADMDEMVPAVSAPGLTTTLTETCMGSTSAGGAVSGFGITFGTTWRDSACVRRLDAREMNSLGYKLAAKEMLCDSPAVAAAFKRAGKPCYVDLPDNLKRLEDQAKVIMPIQEETAFVSPKFDTPSHLSFHDSDI